MDPAYYQAYFEAERTHWWFLARRRILLSLLRRHAPKNGSLRVLDVGCCSGSFVEALHALGHDAYGCDVYPPAIDFGTKRGISQLVVSPDDVLPYGGEMFDVVSVLDVFEHIENESPLLKEVVRVLKPGGVLLVAVPAHPFLWSAHDEVNHHYRRYRRQELLAVLAGAPTLSVRFVSFFNSVLFLPIVVSRVATRARHADTDDGLMPSPAWMNRSLDALFGLEASVLRWTSLPFGVSLVCVLTKTGNGRRD